VLIVTRLSFLLTDSKSLTTHWFRVSDTEPGCIRVYAPQALKAKVERPTEDSNRMDRINRMKARQKMKAEGGMLNAE
jgi:hypothetical protein